MAGAEAAMASGCLARSIGFNSMSASFIPVRLNERHDSIGCEKVRTEQESNASGLSRSIGKDAQDRVLGYSQPSLAGLVRDAKIYPGLTSWATFSQSCPN